MSKIYTPYNRFLIIVALLITCGFNDCTAKEIISSESNPVKIIDGDSLEIGKERIRLMGIDAPEYNQYCKNSHKKKYPCGKISAKHLVEAISTSNIRCKVHKKDQYDRSLCTCYTTDGINLNEEQIITGNALTYMESEYKQQEQVARKNKRGMWQGRFMRPRLFRRLQEQEKLN